MKTLPELFEVGLSRPRERHLLWRDASKAWHGLSTDRVRRDVDLIARGLRDRGLRFGDRVALLSRNSPRWALADHALQAAGLVNVPLYPTLSPEQVRFIVDDCGARFVLVEDRSQLDRVGGALAGSGVEGVALLDAEEAPRGVLLFDQLLEAGAAGGSAPTPPGPDDLATIIYTSGTTGRPKGAMLSQWNLVSNAQQCAEAIELTDQQHVNLSLLPLSHVFQRLVDYLLFQSHATMAYCPSPLEALEYMREVRPTFFASVPRLFEKVRAGFEQKLAHAPAWRRALASWALGVGRRHFHSWYRDGACDGARGPWLALQHAVADRLVLTKVRGIFGGRAAVCFSGGAALPSEIHEFFRVVGLNLLPGYGLTEASPVLATNRVDRMKLGSVGPAVCDLELRTAPDGELLARGPNVMRGYWNLDEETAATIVDGWLHTGDLARIDEQGFVFITGRKKEIFVLSTGKKVAPQLVEDRLTRSPFVAQVLLVGDGRKYVAALVHPSLDHLARAARERGIAFDDPAELLELREAEDLVHESLLDACAGLADFEKPKRVVFLPRELTMAEGELTPTLKLRRSIIVERWAALVDRACGPATRGAAP